MPMPSTFRAFGACALLLPALAAADVFINEIHYDDVDADNDERIEVVATAGEDLTQYSLVLYNGNNAAAAAPYNTTALSAGSPANCSGGGSAQFVVVNYPLDGLQNGVRDGIALVQGASVVQFLSYEGTATATSGPANGLSSVDIGVAETNSTAEGTSLQLGGGPGSSYASFAWNGSASATFGGCNNGQSFAPPVDNLPTVASSVPAHNATDVAFDTSLTVTFSEPVDAIGSWFTFNCGSGTPTLTPTASPATTFTLTPSAPIGYSKLCTLTVLATQIRDRDGTPGFMQFDEQIQFETEADDAPAVLTTVPGDLATGVARAANLSVTFSEPVDAPAAAFGIFCPDNAVSTLPFALSSSDATTFVLDPNADLPAATNCRLYVDNLQVEDLDGVAQNPDLDTRVNFTTAALTPPALVSTIPSYGASNFPSAGDLQVVFDTTVNLAAGAFTLNCSQTGGITLSYASSGSSFTLDTGVALAEGESCTLQIEADAVTSLDGLHPVQDESIAFSVAAGSGAYYQNINLSSPAQLRCTLHQTIRGHTEYAYGWTQLEILDEDPNDANRILDIYRNCSFDKVDSRVGNPGPATTCGAVSGLRYNREHVWPRSLGFYTNDNTTRAPHNDLHMLHLSDETFNAHRGNKPYDTCPQSAGCSEDRTITYNGDTGGNGTYPGNSNWYTAGVDGSNGSYEVWQRWRGNMARALFYMAMRYEGGDNVPDLELTDNRTLIVQREDTDPVAHMGILTTLLQWHAQDVVDEREADRNEGVFVFQGNRNPFVDHPEWASAALFAPSAPTTCVLNTQAPAANDDSYATPLNTLLTVAANDGVLGNDLDAEGAPLVAELVANVASGTLALAANGGFSYTPATGFCGSTSFTYRASDGVRFSVARTATINVGAPCGGGNQPPVANDASFALAENSSVGTVVGTVIASDPDVGQTLSYQITAGNAAGAFTLLGNQIRVADATPLDFEETSQFVLTVTVSDGAAPTPATDTATITIDLSDANDAPTVSQALSNRDAEEGVAIAPFSVATGFADADAGSDLDFSAGNLPAGLVLDAESGQVSGTPAIGSAGVYSVTITASDGLANAQQSFQYTVAAAGEPIFADGFED
jgi:endonuclease I